METGERERDTTLTTFDDVEDAGHDNDEEILCRTLPGSNPAAKRNKSVVNSLDLNAARCWPLEPQRTRRSYTSFNHSHTQTLTQNAELINYFDGL